MKGQMAHDTMGVAGGTGIIAWLILFAGVLLISISFSMVKIAVFAFCAISLAKAVKNPKENRSLKKLALLLLCVPLGIISGYLLLIDLNPIFLNVFANADPSICELHASPLFTLNVLRLEDTMQIGYYGTAYYDDCMRQNPRFGKDLEFCNEIKPEMHSAGGGWATKECIEAATDAGAMNCEVIDDSYLQSLCLEEVGMEGALPEDCREINDESYRNECLYTIATKMEDCEKISGIWRDVCIKNFASVREDCMRIVVQSVQYECYTNFASVMEDCEEIPDEIYRGLCIKKVATKMEDCEKMYKNDDWVYCVSKFATKPEDCDVIDKSNSYWQWEDCVKGINKN